mmetsp:Transcript_46729/g.130107  ORF Transcript_46729/g.130107 Transcript_46729/m.130107 type:complete len:174 (+) Transcript_46729:1134-1655(+)
MTLPIAVPHVDSCCDDACSVRSKASTTSPSPRGDKLGGVAVAGVQLSVSSRESAATKSFANDRFEMFDKDKGRQAVGCEGVPPAWFVPTRARPALDGRCLPLEGVETSRGAWPGPARMAEEGRRAAAAADPCGIADAMHDLSEKAAPAPHHPPEAPRTSARRDETMEPFLLVG